MLERHIEKRIQEYHDKHRVDFARLTVDRINKLVPEPSDTVKRLCEQPDAEGLYLTPPEATWALNVLQMPNARSLNEIESRHEVITERIRWAVRKAPSQFDQAALSNAQGKIARAYDFLSWPQNRARVEYVLRVFEELRPDPEPAHVTNPSYEEIGLHTFKDIIKFFKGLFSEQVTG